MNEQNHQRQKARLQLWLIRGAFWSYGAVVLGGLYMMYVRQDTTLGHHVSMALFALSMAVMRGFIAQMEGRTWLGLKTKRDDCYRNDNDY